MRFRALNRVWAWFAMYFWKPCPLCGQMFGGHEWRDIDGKLSSIPKPGHSVGTSTAICPDCTRAGRGREQVPRMIHVNLDALRKGGISGDEVAAGWMAAHHATQQPGASEEKIPDNIDPDNPLDMQPGQVWHLVVDNEDFPVVVDRESDD